MTVTSTVFRNDYLGAGSTGPFVYGFRIYVAGDLYVATQDPNGLVTVLTYLADFTISVGSIGSRSGGTISLLIPLAVGWKLTVQRNRPLTQLINYRNQGATFPANVEDGFDQATMIGQQVNGLLTRSVRLPATTAPSTFDPTLPANLAPGNAIVVNGSGTGFSMGALSAATLSAWNAAHNQSLDIFLSGVNFTAGVTTQLTLSNPPGNANNVQITFDVAGVVTLLQSDDFSVSGSVITFGAPITTGTTRVECKYLFTYQVNTAASENVTYSQIGVGAVARTVRAKIREMTSVLDFGAQGDGVTDDTTAIQAAINAVNGAGGGILFFPIGTYICSSTLSMLQTVTLQGAGKAVSMLKWNTTGDGVAFVGTVNVQTLANTAVRDLALVCTNVSNTAGGGYTDLGGTFVELTNVHIKGFGYGIIFDQTELGDVDLCNIELQKTGAIWLCNGSDHTPGANTAFTNRISVKRTQINEGTTVYGIIDDGGYAHTFDANNYNGCLSSIRVASALALTITASEFESAGGSALVQFQATTLKTGTSVGNAQGVGVHGNLMLQSASHPCVFVGVTSVNSLMITGNYLSTNGVALSGLPFGYVISGTNLYNGSGSLYDGLPFEGFLTLSNGDNNDVVLPVWNAIADGTSFVQLVGLTADYAITGIVPDFPGRVVTLLNRMSHTLTVRHNSASSAAGNRIDSQCLSDIVVPNFGSITLRYDHTEGHWMVMSVSHGTVAINSALSGYVTGAFGLDSDANMHALYNMVVNIRSILITQGFSV